MTRSLADAHAALDRSRQALAAVLEGLDGPSVDLDTLLSASAASMQALEHARAAIDAAVTGGSIARVDVSDAFRSECAAIADLIAIAHAEVRRSLGDTEAEMRRVRGLHARFVRQKQRVERARDCDVSA